MPTMRSLLPLIFLIIVALSACTAVHGRRYHSLAPKVASTTNRRSGGGRRTNLLVVAQKSSTPATTTTTTSPLVKIPWLFVKGLAKSTVYGFVGGYVLGAVCSLWGVIRDAMDGENGLRELHDRSFQWGKTAAKWYARIFAVVAPLLLVLIPSLQTRIDGMAERGEIDADQYRELTNSVDELLRRKSA